ncbi:hypothetical protein Efla_004057 [Eimeria flavescens]
MDLKGFSRCYTKTDPVIHINGARYLIPGLSVMLVITVTLPLHVLVVATRGLRIWRRLATCNQELTEFKSKQKQVLEDWAEDFAKIRGLEETQARHEERIGDCDQLPPQDSRVEEENSKRGAEVLRQGARRKGLYESPLSSEREERARLRATLSELRAVQESPQVELEKNTLPRSLEELTTRLGDLEALQRRGMCDRVKIHRLEL